MLAPPHHNDFALKWKQATIKKLLIQMEAVRQTMWAYIHARVCSVTVWAIACVCVHAYAPTEWLEVDALKRDTYTH